MKDYMKKIYIVLILLCANLVHGAVTDLNDSNFTDATSDGNVLVKFYGPHCPPCRMSRPALEQMSNAPEYAQVQFYEVDIDGRNDMVATKFGVQSMPTFVLLKGGREIDRVVGFDENGLRAKLNKYFGPGKSKKKEVPAPKAVLEKEKIVAAEEMPAPMLSKMLEEELAQPEEMSTHNESWYSPVVDFFTGIYDSIYNFMFR